VAEPVSSVDYLMYRSEVEPRLRSTMMSVEILDRTPDWHRLRQVFDRASRAVPRLRQRVVAPVMALGNPAWVVDPDFDLDFHLRRIRCPEPGTLQQVLDLARPMLSAPFDRARPLWEATLVEGVKADGGAAALIWKLSHAISDGLGAIELDRQVRDFDRDMDRGPMPPLPVPEEVTALALTTRSPLSLISGGGRFAAVGLGLLGRAARNPVRTAAGVAGFAGSLRRLVAGPPAKPSPLLARRSLHRRLDTIDVPVPRKARRTR
jgi:diacylglycerol O-acyltransferase / wax synthase